MEEAKNIQNITLKFKSKKLEDDYQDWRREKEKPFYSRLFYTTIICFSFLSLIFAWNKMYNRVIRLMILPIFSLFDYLLWQSKRFHCLGGCMPRASCFLILHAGIIHYESIFVSPTSMWACIITCLLFVKVSTNWILGSITEALTTIAIIIRLSLAQTLDKEKINVALVSLIALFATFLISFLLYTNENSSRIRFVLLQERKKQIEELKNLNNELMVLNTKINDEMKNKKEFFACMCHELRNPLNSILGNIELLEQGKMDLEIIDSSKICGQVLNNLIGNILDFSQLEAGKMELTSVVTDVREKAANIVSMFKGMAEKKGLFLRVIPDQILPAALKLDSRRLLQVLINFVANALKFTHQGGITINLSWIPYIPNNENKSGIREEISKLLDVSNREELQHITDEFEALSPRRRKINIPTFSPTHKNKLKLLTIRHNKTYSEGKFPENFGLNDLSLTQRFFEPDNTKSSGLISSSYHEISPSFSTLAVKKSKQGFLKIEVIDTGIGISQTNQLKLFKPFQQATQSTSQKYGGTGLGLCVAKEIINKMGGEVRIESEEGEGSNFMLAIPAIPTLEHGIVQMDGEELWKTTGNMFKGKNVLICEDYIPNHPFLSKVLTHSGFRTYIATNGKKGLEYFRNHRINYYDLIITNLRMPLMSGTEFIINIRELCKEKSIPIIVITADLEETTRIRCQNTLKVDDYLTKPLKFEELINSIKSIFLKIDRKSILPEIRLNTGSSKSNLAPKILIVEDDGFQNNLLANFLKLRNYNAVQCFSFEDVKTYQQKIAIGEFRIITLDNQLGDSDGNEIAHFLRELQNKSKIRLSIISVSGDPIEKQKLNYKNVFIDSFLEKPVSSEQFLNEISLYYK